MRKLSIFIIATLLIACEYNDTGLNSNPIESKITIETRELLEPTSRRLTFYCKTEKIYPCINFPILTEKEINQNSVKITFTSVGEIGACLTSLGPATASVDLNTIPNGQYQIQFNNANLKNEGTLKITDTEITLHFGQENAINIIRPNTKRVPDKTYWGTIGYRTESSSTLADEFIQKLSAKGAMFKKQRPGHYFYYQIDADGDIITDTKNSGDYFVRAFIFQYDGDESELKDLLQIDGKNYKGDLSINIQTYKGERITN